jgi:hypothetical protein
MKSKQVTSFLQPMLNRNQLYDHDHSNKLKNHQKTINFHLQILHTFQNISI